MIYVLAIAVLTVILWVLYHRIFNVVYFGGALNTIIKEFIGCLLVAVLLVGVGKFLLSSVFGFLGKVLGFLGRVLLFILKVGLIGGGVILVIVLIVKLIDYIRERRSVETDLADEAGGVVPDESEAVEPAAETRLQNEIEDRQMTGTVISQPESSEYENTLSEPEVKKEEISSKIVAGRQEMIFCMYCGKRISRTAKFCNFCGSENNYR